MRSDVQREIAPFRYRLQARSRLSFERRAVVIGVYFSEIRPYVFGTDSSVPLKRLVSLVNTTTVESRTVSTSGIRRPRESGKKKKFFPETFAATCSVSCAGAYTSRLNYKNTRARALGDATDSFSPPSPPSRRLVLPGYPRARCIERVRVATSAHAPLGPIV